MSHKKLLPALLIIATTLGGCATNNNLYYWGDGQYRESVYQHLQGNISSDEEIQHLTEVIAKAKSSQKAIPPGIYAQLGMVYAQQGNNTQAIEAFNQEKALFPESTPFIDHLLSKYQTGTKPTPVTTQHQYTKTPKASHKSHSKKGGKA